MKTATIRELRYDFPRVEAWLQEGEVVELTRRGKTIAMITPTTAKSFVKPDIMERLNSTWERTITESDLKYLREAELEGEEG